MIMYYNKRDYKEEQYKSWRLAVYTRDNFVCQFPCCKTKKGLNAHHIIRWADAPFLRYTLDNGITLCSFHHKMVTGAEESYMEMFHDIIRSKKE